MTDTDHLLLNGIGVSAGHAHGPAVIVRKAAGVDANEPACLDAAIGGQQVRAAMQAVSESLKSQAEKLDGVGADILNATSHLARDRGLAKAIDKKLVAGLGITTAVHNAVGDYAQMLKSLGGYMAERLPDLYDVRDRTICELRGLPAPGIPHLSEPSVLVAHDLSPAQTVTLKPELVLGIVTESGGPTSHTAILAAQLGIPAVLATAGVMEIPPGTPIALDGGSGTVIVNPNDGELELLTQRHAKRAALLEGSAGAGHTKDGHQVVLLANTGTQEDARAAAALDVEGTGLFRSEFLFLDREEAPSLEEQTETYTQVLQAFAGRRVVVRTLDAGADKPLSFANLGAEDNPALGRRGLRLSMIRKDLLLTQLQALAAAQAATGGDLRVMAPMVSTLEEAEWFTNLARSAGLTQVGIMIEVPAAAIRAKDLLSVCDFASIGTNDLSQYTMAADRMTSELAELISPWQGAVLEMISLACQGAVSHRVHIGVCGEAGGDPLLALVLTGLGVRSLSMAPSKVAAVRVALSLHDLSTCELMARAAISARTAAQARQAVLELADPAMSILA